MPDVLHIGNVIVSTHMLILLVSTAVALLLMVIRIKRLERHRLSFQKKLNLDPFVHSLLIAVIVWKLSVIGLEPGLIVQHPLSLFYFSGGEMGGWIAACCALLYAVYCSHKTHTPMLLYVDVWFVGGLAGSVFYEAVYGIVDPSRRIENGLHMILKWVVLGSLMRTKSVRGAGLNQAVLWLSLGMLALSFLHKAVHPVFYEFSLRQVIYFVLALLTLFNSYRLASRKNFF